MRRYTCTAILVLVRSYRLTESCIDSAFISSARAALAAAYAIWSPQLSLNNPPQTSHPNIFASSHMEGMMEGLIPKAPLACSKQVPLSDKVFLCCCPPWQIFRMDGVGLSCVLGCVLACWYSMFCLSPDKDKIMAKAKAAMDTAMVGVPAEDIKR